MLKRFLITSKRYRKGCSLFKSRRSKPIVWRRTAITAAYGTNFPLLIYVQRVKKRHRNIEEKTGVDWRSSSRSRKLCEFVEMWGFSRPHVYLADFSVDNRTDHKQKKIFSHFSEFSGNHLRNRDLHFHKKLLCLLGCYATIFEINLKRIYQIMSPVEGGKR